MNKAIKALFQRITKRNYNEFSTCWAPVRRHTRGNYAAAA